MEIPFVFAFPLPAVTQIRIVADDRHHAALIVEDSLEVHVARVAAMAPFPRDPLIAPVPGRVNAGDLRFLLETIDTLEDLVIQVELRRLAIGKDALDLPI